MTIGVYQIYNLANNKRYIGESTNVEYRWKDHKGRLNRGEHTNKLMQSEWNEYGSAAFHFDILEIIEPQYLPIRERYWINLYQTMKKENGYNTTYYKGDQLCSKRERASQRFEIDSELLSQFYKYVDSHCLNKGAWIESQIKIFIEENKKK